MLDAAVISFLETDTVVSDLVGTRVYYALPPATARTPYILVTGLAESKTGERPAAIDAVGRVRVSVVDEDLINGRFAAETVRTRLMQYRGNLGELADCVINCTGVVVITGEVRSQHTFDVEIAFTEVK